MTPFPSLQCVFGAREHHRQWMLCANHVCLRHIQELSDSEGTAQPYRRGQLPAITTTCLCALVSTTRLRTLKLLIVKR